MGNMLSRWGAAASSLGAEKALTIEEQGMERAAQATLSVRQDRILPSEAHSAARRSDAENVIRGDEER